MNRSSEQFFRGVISGQRSGLAARALRGVAAVAEPVYGLGVRLRNWGFDARVRRAKSAPRPVVCVGNVTTGGTGKTPVVHWLADELRRRGHRPSILMRGYKSHRSRGGNDEQRLLEQLLNDASPEGEPREPRVPIVADPDRVGGARRALEIDPQVTCFILDDGFQHRRLRREFDLVLIDATNPFGHGRLLPRGLLREPLSGLRRAHALVLTHVEAVSADVAADIDTEIRRHNAWAPIYRCRHLHRRLITPQDQPLPLDLRDRAYLAFCGVGNPESFVRQLESTGGRCVETHFFPDHHAYTEADLLRLEKEAKKAGADVMITTQKDWVKLRTLAMATQIKPPVWRVDLAIEFAPNDDARLLEQVLATLPAGSAG